MPVLGPSLQVSTPFSFRVISFEPLERFLLFFHQIDQLNVSFLVARVSICAGPRSFSIVSTPFSFGVISFEPLERFLPFFHQIDQLNVSFLVARVSICVGARSFSTSLYTIFFSCYIF